MFIRAQSATLITTLFICFKALSLMKIIADVMNVAACIILQLGSVTINIP